MTAISLPVQYMFRCDIGIDDYRSMEIYPNSVVGFVQISRAAVESWIKSEPRKVTRIEFARCSNDVHSSAAHNLVKTATKHCEYGTL